MGASAHFSSKVSSVVKRLPEKETSSQKNGINTLLRNCRTLSTYQRQIQGRGAVAQGGGLHEGKQPSLT